MDPLVIVGWIMAIIFTPIVGGYFYGVVADIVGKDPFGVMDIDRTGDVDE